MSTDKDVNLWMLLLNIHHQTDSKLQCFYNLCNASGWSLG